MEKDFIIINKQKIPTIIFYWILSQAIELWHEEHFQEKTLKKFIQNIFIPIFNEECYDYAILNATDIPQIENFIKKFRSRISSVDFKIYLLED